MPFVVENKNGAAAPLGSIKDRIKSFEFMKDTGTTSPRARSPIPQTSNENVRTQRRTGNSWEKDGNERRQMRRSERREAELRRENELLALKAKEKSFIQRDEGNGSTEALKTEKTPIQAPERQIPRAPPRAILSVIPREKEKPPEPGFRRRRNENKEPALRNNEIMKSTNESLQIQNSVPLGKLPSTQDAERSSNEIVHVSNSSEEPSYISNEETDESKEKQIVKELQDVEDEDDGNEENEEYEDENEEDEQECEVVEENTETEEDMEQLNNGEEDDDNDDDDDYDDYEGTEQEGTEDETEEETEEEEERSDESENEEDEMRFEPPTKHHKPRVNNEQLKPERNKQANSTDVRKNSRKQLRDGDNLESVNERNQQKNRHHKEKATKGTEVPYERRRSYEKSTKQHQRQSSVSGSESGDLKPLRQRKENGSMEAENTSEAPKETKTKQHRRHSSGAGKDLMKIKEEGSRNTSNHSVDRSDSLNEKAKKDEQHHVGLVRTKSVNSKGVRRSRNSLKSIPAEDLAESVKDTSEKQAGSKSKQATRKEDGTSNTPSGRNSRKTSCAEDDISEKAVEENEVISQSGQLHLYSNNVLGLASTSIHLSVDAESEGTSSPELKHDEVPSKKAFVCAIHEEPCKYYCQDCERLICSECAMRWGDCHEHYYLRVKDAWKKYREEMMKILQEARSSVSHIQEDILENSRERDSFKLKVESTIKKINSFFDEHIQALEKRRTNFLETVEEIMKFREIGINQEIDSLQNTLVETNGTINIAGRVYGTSTMMEFLQVCKQLTNRLLELGHKKIKLNVTESIDIDFITEPSLFEDIEKLGQLKKHKDSPSTKLLPEESGANAPGEELTQDNGEVGSKVTTDQGKSEENEQDSMDSVVGTSTENLSESTSAKDTNDMPKKYLPKNAEQSIPPNDFHTADVKKTEEPVKMNSNEELKKEINSSLPARPGLASEEAVIKQVISTDQNLRSVPNDTMNTADRENAECPCVHADNVDYRNGLGSDVENVAAVGNAMKQNPSVVQQHHVRRHSMDDVLGSRNRKEEIQRRLGNMGRYRPPKSVAQFLDDGERYFSSGEAEQRRRKQEYYKVRFNERAYYSNPSDSSELEEMRGYDFEDRPVRQKVRRHRTMPLIRPISEKRELKSPWTLDVFRYHGKIHFSRNSLKATGKAFGWNAVVGCQGFSQGKHTWKVRVTKWTAVGVCYKDDHVDNPSWGAGNKWTWDSADMCYSPRLGVCESPVGEWIDGDVIALELDCDNSVLIVHNLRTSETDKLYGFKEPVYPYFYLSVFRSISIIEIDGIQVGS